jgi:choline dehydrogenase
LPDTTVAKVLFDGHKTTGIALLPTNGGNMTTLRAFKEVILAAGCPYTPQLLQLSGVGSEPLLNGLGIHVGSNVPGLG